LLVRKNRNWQLCAERLPVFVLGYITASDVPPVCVEEGARFRIKICSVGRGTNVVTLWSIDLCHTVCKSLPSQ